jgi:hypothetical protein
MSHSLAAALSQNPLVRAALVTIALFVFLGAATGALPVQCLATGVAACAAPPAARTIIFPTDAKPTAEIAQVEASSVPVPVPSLTNNEVVSSTFAVLNAALQAPQSVTSLATIPASATASSAPDDGLRTRIVQTTVIHVSDIGSSPNVRVPDPLAASSAPAAALPTVAPLAPPAGSPIITASLPTTDTTPPVKPKPAVIVAPKPHVSNVTITGQGANARSSPTMGAGVLFALTGGTKVVVLGDQRGWLQVKDPRGRTGWVYSDFVSKS